MRLSHRGCERDLSLIMLCRKSKDTLLPPQGTLVSIQRSVAVFVQMVVGLQVAAREAHPAGRNVYRPSSFRPAEISRKARPWRLLFGDHRTAREPCSRTAALQISNFLVSPKRPTKSPTTRKAPAIVSQWAVASQLPAKTYGPETISQQRRSNRTISSAGLLYCRFVFLARGAGRFAS